VTHAPNECELFGIGGHRCLIEMISDAKMPIPEAAKSGNPSEAAAMVALPPPSHSRLQPPSSRKKVVSTTDVST
jgi:hypothetical protein